MLTATRPLGLCGSVSLSCNVRAISASTTRCMWGINLRSMRRLPSRHKLTCKPFQQSCQTGYRNPLESCTVLRNLRRIPFYVLLFPHPNPQHPPQHSVEAAETLFSYPPQEPAVADAKDDETPATMR